MPHGWLVTGPRGIGKATLAYRLARFVLSAGTGQHAEPGLFGEPEPQTGLGVDADNAAVRLVAAGSHPDMLIIERSVNPTNGQLRRSIVVEDVSRLSSFLHLTPAAGGWRIVVVDSVDDMNSNSANALLKLLEEPPRNSLLLLVCHAPGGQLATIRSRCRRLKLAPLGESDLRAVLRRHTPELDPETATLAVHLAEGSVGRALAITQGEGLQVLREAMELLGGAPPIDRERLRKTVGRWARSSREEDGTSLAERLDLLLEWTSAGIRTLASGDQVEALAGERQVFQALAERHGLGECCARLAQARAHVREGLALNLDGRQLASSVITTIAE